MGAQDDSEGLGITRGVAYPVFWQNKSTVDGTLGGEVWQGFGRNIAWCTETLPMFCY